MKRLFYFAYGSNLNTTRLRSRIGNAKIHRVHRLQNWELVFNCSGFANIQPAPGKVVEGVLYEITSDQLNDLDRIEGFYRKEFFDIEDGGLAIVYVGLNRSIWDFLPNLSYLNIVLDGLEEHNLLKTYNEVVDFKDKNYKLKFGSRHKKKAIRSVNIQ